MVVSDADEVLQDVEQVFRISEADDAGSSDVDCGGVVGQEQAHGDVALSASQGDVSGFDFGFHVLAQQVVGYKPIGGRKDYKPEARLRWGRRYLLLILLFILYYINMN